MILNGKTITFWSWTRGPRGNRAAVWGSPHALEFESKLLAAGGTTMSDPWSRQSLCGKPTPTPKDAATRGAFIMPEPDPPACLCATCARMIEVRKRDGGEE